MRSAAWVLSIFAALWGVAAAIIMQAPKAWALLPCLISVALIVIAGRVHLPDRTGADAARAKKVLGWAFGIEMIAIFVATTALGHFGAQAYVMAAAAAIVGLHFVPLAIGLPAPAYYATGGLLVLAAAIGLMLPEPARDLSISVTAAMILWGTVASFLWSGRRLSPR